MVSRRTYARLQLAVAVFVLWLTFRIRRMFRDNEDRWRDDDSIDPPPALSASEMALGAAEQVAYQWVHDRDIWGVRSSRRRRYLFSAVRLLVGRRLLSRDEADRYSRGMGGMVGTIAYRVWYGLLRPLPGDAGD